MTLVRYGQDQEGDEPLLLSFARRDYTKWVRLVDLRETEGQCAVQ
jgi:hypothetical protein